MTGKTLRYAIALAAVAAGGMLTASPLASAQPAPATAPATGPASKPAVDPNKVVIRFGAQTITAGEFDEFIAELPPQYQAMAHGHMKRQIAEDLVKVKMMAAEAEKRKLDQSPNFKKRLDLTRQQILAGVLFEDLSKDEAELKKYYEAHKEQTGEVTARHILIVFEGSRAADPSKKALTDAEAKAKADAIRARLEKGEDFAAIAKAESDDKSSGARGGDLGSFGHKDMVKVFADVAFAMKVGEISQPVKSEFGYHIIQVKEHKIPTFDESKAELGAARAEEAVEEMKKAANPQFDDAFFPAAATRPAHPIPLEGME